MRIHVDVVNLVPTFLRVEEVVLETGQRLFVLPDQDLYGDLAEACFLAPSDDVSMGLQRSHAALRIHVGVLIELIEFEQQTRFNLTAR